LSAAGKDRAGHALAAIAIVLLALLLGSASARAAAPANDDFANAIPLPEFPGEKSGSNAEATKESGEPDHAGNPGGHSVWYSWTPSSDRRIGIRSGNCFGGAIDTLIAVYTGSAVSALSPVASNESPFPGNCFGEAPQAEFEAVGGTTYWIAVDGRDGAEGNFELDFSGPPANDDFASATVLAAPPQTIFGTTRLASKQAGEPDHAEDPGGHSVWYSWTPTASEPVRIYTCSSFTAFDSVLAVYTGSEVGALAEVASNDEAADPLAFPGCADSNSEVTIDAVAGTTYRIAVDGAQGKMGRFNLTLQGRPENDKFAAAKVLSPTLPVSSVEGTTKFATKESGEPDHAGNPGGHSVWFSWTPSSSGPAKISTCGYFGEMDTVLGVYTGSELAAATLVAANDDGPRPRCGDRDSEVDLSAVAGTTYRIAVDGKDGVEGAFTLHIEAPPANDDFAQAQGLPETFSVSTSGTNGLASEEPGEPKHAGTEGGGSVWFSWTAPESGPAVISACPYFENSPDTLLAVYTGDLLADLTPVAASDDSPSGCQEVASEASFVAVAHTTYRIAVDSKGDGGGIFSLDVNGGPANDDFSAATVLGFGPAGFGGSTVFAGKESGEPNHAGDPGGHSLWFSWTPTQSGPIDLYACGRPTVDTLLGVYTGSAVNALSQVAADDDSAGIPQNGLCQPGNGNSEVVFNATAGTTYRIAVDTKNSEGRFGLYLEGPPQNDDFANASELYPGLPSFSSAFTKLATKQSGEPDHAGAAGGHSVWFSWTAESSGPRAIETCTWGGDLDTVLGVFTGNQLASLSEVVSDDDGQNRKGCRASDSAAEFNAVAGTTYEIAVDGKAGTVGGVQLFVEGAPANDDFGNAHPLGGKLPVTAIELSNRFATKQAGEPDHAGDGGGASVWFKWTAPRSGTVSADTCEGDFDSLLAVYTGGAFGTLTPVQSNDDGGGSCSPRSRLSFAAVGGTTYRIAVDGKGGAEGTFALHLVERPSNDTFEAAAVIPGRPGWYWPGTTMLATKQSGEPDHGGDAGGHSVWFSWTPRKSWEVEIDACSGSFDPLIGVYTGAAVGGLAPVATSDAGSGECNEGRSVAFTTVAGETYHLALDGAGGDVGHFLLHLRAVSILPHTLTVDTAGTGAGTVGSSVAGISCGAICSHDYEEGTAVVLTATPVAGSTFAGWSGGGCSGTAPCQIAVNGDTDVTATFEGGSEGGGGEEAGGGGSSGGGSAGDGGQTPPVSTPPPTTLPAKKPLRCKRGFKKKVGHGKPRCVKKHTPKKHHRHR
jgi:Divergent InlB B-repeat domain